MKSPARSALSLALIAAISASTWVDAATLVWNGASGAPWGSQSSWLGNAVPTIDDDVILGTRAAATADVTAIFNGI